MADEGFGSADVTGRWTGFYRYRSEEVGNFPIVAEIRQQGGRISGEMYDQVTDVSDTLERFLEIRGDEISPLRRSSLEKTVSRLGSQSFIVTYQLPDTSDIAGTIQGEQVKFTKTYRGPVVHNSTLDGKIVGSLMQTCHTVYYSGQLVREQGFISGQWLIKRRGFFAGLLPPRSWGAFELYRKS